MIHGRKTRSYDVGAVVCAGALTTALEARAQSAVVRSIVGGASSASAIPDMTMGMGFLPLPGMFGSPTPSATDAAALGMTAPQGRNDGDGRRTGNGNPFMNPMASPFCTEACFR